MNYCVINVFLLNLVNITIKQAVWALSMLCSVSSSHLEEDIHPFNREMSLERGGARAKQLWLIELLCNSVSCQE